MEIDRETWTRGPWSPFVSPEESVSLSASAGGFFGLCRMSRLAMTAISMRFSVGPSLGVISSMTYLSELCTTVISRSEDDGLERGYCGKRLK